MEPGSDIPGRAFSPIPSIDEDLTFLDFMNRNTRSTGSPNRLDCELKDDDLIESKRGVELQVATAKHNLDQEIKMLQDKKKEWDQFLQTKLSHLTYVQQERRKLASGAQNVNDEDVSETDPGDDYVGMKRVIRRDLSYRPPKRARTD